MPLRKPAGKMRSQRADLRVSGGHAALGGATSGLRSNSSLGNPDRQHSEWRW